MSEDTVVLPAVDSSQDGPIYRAISRKEKKMTEAKKSLADMGLSRVTLVHMDDGGVIRTVVKIVQQDTLTSVLGLLEDGEVG